MTSARVPPAPILLAPILLSFEFWSGVALLGWGGWVYWHPDVLADLPSYEPISRYLPDGFWANSFIAVGFAQVMTRVLNGWCARTLTAFLAMVLWKCLTFSIVNSPEPGPNALVLCALALGNMATAAGYFFPGFARFVSRRRHATR